MNDDGPVTTCEDCGAFVVDLEFHRFYACPIRAEKMRQTGRDTEG
jgi:hypothetical protein